MTEIVQTYIVVGLEIRYTPNRRQQPYTVWDRAGNIHLFTKTLEDARAYCLKFKDGKIGRK